MLLLMMITMMMMMLHIYISRCRASLRSHFPLLPLIGRTTNRTPAPAAYVVYVHAVCAETCAVSLSVAIATKLYSRERERERVDG